MKLYVAKVVRRDDTRSNAITLFAEDDDDALQQVSSSAVGADRAFVHVASLALDGQEHFDRWIDDVKGIVEHSDVAFSDNGPISTFSLFTKRQH